MSTFNLDKVFKPRRIAVIGASPRPGALGETVLRNLRTAGFQGAVHPVNPKYSQIDGQTVRGSVLDIPDAPDLAVICTPAATVRAIVGECGAAGVAGVVILSAGFREIGETGAALERELAEEARRFRGLRVIGPNCLGIIAPEAGLNASFAAQTPSAGRLAFISQSGALCTAILDWAVERGVGFSHFVSIGNMVDVDFGDLIDYFGRQPEVRSIMFYAESVTNARKFMSAARAFSRIKPIVAYKSGRFAESAKAATSHTGALAGEDAVFDAAFARAGIERCFEIDDMFDCAELLAWQRVPLGPNLAIITNAGGPGVMAADALLARGGALATLAPSTLDRLNAVLPGYWSHGNPVDILGDAPAQRYRAATEIVLQDESVDGLLIALTPQAMTDPTGTAEAVAELSARSPRPILASWMGGRTVAAGIERLNQVKIPTYGNPGQAVRAFMHLVSYGRNRDVLYETPRDVVPQLVVDREDVERHLAAIRRQAGTLISEDVCKSLLTAYGVPTARTLVAGSESDAVAAAREIGFPVVLKVLSPDIAHKTDVGGVELGLADEAAVRAAFDRITGRVERLRPAATIRGVTVQEMIQDGPGHELIVGAKKDATFGSVLLVGTGGIAAEVLNDRVLELPPLNESLARRMLERLRGWPLLCGYRGRPGVHLDRLIEALIRFSYLVADLPEIAEIEVNPLLASERRVIALDARAVRDDRCPSPPRPFEHLAIRPYPEKYRRRAALRGGGSVALRPIRPEDEPLWQRFLASCSFDSLHARFRYSFKLAGHDMASRFCFIDYDREMAIVAELEGPGERKLAGIGRLVADPDHEVAEYALLVADEWQGRGLGSLITEYCLEIAADWGVSRVTATTEHSNTRMLAVFRHFGFELRDDPEEGVVCAEKRIA
jgi:acetyltransferase